jgi:hypothetical protein
VSDDVTHAETPSQQKNFSQEPLFNECIAFASGSSQSSQDAGGEDAYEAESGHQEWWGSHQVLKPVFHICNLKNI